MRTTVRVLMAALLGIVLTLSVVPAQNAAAVTSFENLNNRSFETYTAPSKIPVGWVAGNFGKGDGIYTLNPAYIHGGFASIKMSGTYARGKRLTQNLTWVSGGPLSAQYVFSYWVKGYRVPRDGSCLGKVVFYDESRAVATKILRCGSTKTFGWKQVTMTFLAPPNFVQAKVIFVYSKPSGKVWFDDASFVRLDP